MTGYLVTESAFTGFRVVKEHFRALPFWALIALTLSLTINILFLTMGVKMPDAQLLQEDPSLAPVFLAHLAPFILFTAIIAVVANGVIYGAMNRVVLKPSEGRWGFVRLGADELRQMGLLLLLIAIFSGVYLGGVMVSILSGVLFAMAGKFAGIVAASVGGATVLCGLVVLVVRLSLASAETFETGKISLGGSWALTRGKFWPLLGTYVLATAMTLVVLLLAWLVELGLGAALTGGQLQAFVGGQPATLAALFAPVTLLRVVLAAVVSSLIWPLFLTPAAAIYRQLVTTQVPEA